MMHILNLRMQNNLQPAQATAYSRETCNTTSPEGTPVRGQEEEEQVEDEDQLAWKV